LQVICFPLVALKMLFASCPLGLGAPLSVVTLVRTAWLPLLENSDLPPVLAQSWLLYSSTCSWKWTLVRVIFVLSLFPWTLPVFYTFCFLGCIPGYFYLSVFWFPYSLFSCFTLHLNH
jgi:hypothetical protein